MALILKTGSLLWTGDTGLPRGHQARSDTGLIIGAAALATFATAIAAKSLCNASFSYLIYTYDVTAGAPGTGANVDKKGMVYFRDPDTMEVLHFLYPDPIAADLEDVGWGKRIKKSAVTAIVALISTLSGVSYVPLYGTFMQRS